MNPDCADDKEEEEEEEEEDDDYDDAGKITSKVKAPRKANLYGQRIF
jgi:hypothetical protein